MRPATFSTQEPPVFIDCVETKEYINGLRRRIEVQNDLMEALATEVHGLKKQNSCLGDEVEKLSLDLGIKNEEVGSGWTEVPK